MKYIIFLVHACVCMCVAGGRGCNPGSIDINGQTPVDFSRVGISPIIYMKLLEINTLADVFSLRMSVWIPLYVCMCLMRSRSEYFDWQCPLVLHICPVTSHAPI